MTVSQVFSTDEKLDIVATWASFGPGMAVDTEGIDRWLGVSVASEGPFSGFYFPIDHDQATGNITSSQKSKLLELLDAADYHVYHNAAHDLPFMEKFGYKYEGKFYDTMLMAHWINEELFAYDLSNVSKWRGGKPKNMRTNVSDYIDTEGWDSTSIRQMDEYSSHDAFITWDAFVDMLPEFQKQGFDGQLWATEQEFIRLVMVPMVRRGIRVDLDFSAQEYIKGTTRMAALLDELKFNPSSRKDLERILIGELRLPVVKHSSSCQRCKKRDPVANHKGTPSFDKFAMAEYDIYLEAMNDDRAKKILEYRGWQKTTSSNYKPYMELSRDGVLHPGYKLHGTRTGRLSCEKPNLQQIPKTTDKPWNGGLKHAFIPREGFGLWTIDFSQLQFRMTCAYAAQSNLIDIFNDRARDIFIEMATDLGFDRDHTKTLVYTMLFGGGANRISVVFKVSIARGKVILDKFYSKYPNIKAISKQCENAAKKLGYVTYWTGRRRHFPRGIGAHKAFNAVIQGGEAEILKRCMIALAKEVCDENCFMVLQIHDEVVFEIKKDMEERYLAEAQRVMERVPKEFCKFVGVDIDFKTSAGAWGSK